MSTQDISQALEDPNCDTYNVLRNTAQDKKLEALLEIYAFGTVRDYHRYESSLPSLSAAQLTRLQQLSLVSLCTGKAKVSFQEIAAGLQLEETQLISVLAQLGDAAVIKFHIDQVGECVVVDEIVQERDVLTSQDKPLQIVQTEQTVAQLIEYLEFFQTTKVAQTQKAVS